MRSHPPVILLLLLIFSVVGPRLCSERARASEWITYMRGGSRRFCGLCVALIRSEMDDPTQLDKSCRSPKGNVRHGIGTHERVTCTRALVVKVKVGSYLRPRSASRLLSVRLSRPAGSGIQAGQWFPFLSFLFSCPPSLLHRDVLE
jgi:hypothetical protein